MKVKFESKIWKLKIRVDGALFPKAGVRLEIHQNRVELPHVFFGEGVVFRPSKGMEGLGMVMNDVVNGVYLF